MDIELQVSSFFLLCTLKILLHCFLIFIVFGEESTVVLLFLYLLFLPLILLRLSVITGLKQLDYDVLWCIFLHILFLVRVHRTFWIRSFMVFSKFGNISTMISSIFSFSSPCPSAIPMTHITRLLEIAPQLVFAVFICENISSVLYFRQFLL